MTGVRSKMCLINFNWCYQFDCRCHSVGLADRQTTVQNDRIKRLNCLIGESLKSQLLATFWCTIQSGRSRGYQNHKAQSALMTNFYLFIFGSLFGLGSRDFAAFLSSASICSDSASGTADCVQTVFSSDRNSNDRPGTKFGVSKFIKRKIMSCVHFAKRRPPLADCRL